MHLGLAQISVCVSVFEIRLLLHVLVRHIFVFALCIFLDDGSPFFNYSTLFTGSHIVLWENLWNIKRELQGKHTNTGTRNTQVLLLLVFEFFWFCCYLSDCIRGVFCLLSN